MEALDRPAESGDLYIDRGTPVPPWRPVMQGDVFEGITVPNADPHDAFLIPTHPCTRRGGGEPLTPVLQAAPVVDYRPAPLEHWTNRHYRVFPLPDLTPGRPKAARLGEAGLICTTRLDLNRPVAILSEDGILLFQQRFVFCLTRAKISLARLDEASRHVLDEAELLEDWNEALARTRVTGGEPLEEALSGEAEEFDAFLGQGNPALR